jgi:hypothetical protein
MLINARDPRQWTDLRNLPPKKKKKTLVLTNVGKRAVGGGGITYPPELWILKINNQKIKNKVPGI